MKRRPRRTAEYQDSCLFCEFLWDISTEFDEVCGLCGISNKHISQCDQKACKSFRRNEGELNCYNPYVDLDIELHKKYNMYSEEGEFL